ESVDIISSDGGTEIGADLLHIQPECSHLVVIEINLGLRLVDFGVDVAKPKYVRLHCFGEYLLREFEDSLLIRGGSDDETNREIIAAGQRRGHDRKQLDPRNRREFLLNGWKIRCGRCFTDPPRL